MDPGCFDGRKRAYSDDVSDENSQNLSLGGSNWAGAGSATNRHTPICAQNQQLRRRIFQRALAADPSGPVWERGLQGYPDLYLSPIRQPRQPPDRDVASRLESLGHAAAFQSLHDSLVYSLPSEGSSVQFGHIMPDERRSAMPEVAGYPVHSDSDDSHTLRGSFSASQNESQDGTLDRSFDPPSDLPYPFPVEAVLAYPPVDDVAFSASDYTASYPETSLVLSQHGQYPELWQNREADMPWSPFNPSREHATALTRRPRVSPLPGDVLDCHANGRQVQHLPQSIPYPPDISNSLTDASWPLNEPCLPDYTSQWPEPLPDHVEEPYLDEDLVFYGDERLPELQVQCQEERENSPYLYPSFNRQNSLSFGPWPPVEIPRSVNVLAKDPLLTERTITRKKNRSKGMSRVIDKMSFSTQNMPSEPNDQSTPTDALLARTDPSDCVWQNSIISKGTFRQLNDQTTSKRIKKKKAGRTGPLPTESKIKAGRIRERGACWRCWFLHLSCSLEPVCSQCQTSPFSLSSHICNKAHLHEYTDLLFPSLVVARRHPSAVQQQMNENISGFTNNRVVVNLSSGPGYPSITIAAYEFLPIPTRANELLSVYCAPPNVHSPMPTLERIYSPPLGLKDNKDDSKLRENCQKNIREVIKHSRFSKEATDGDASHLSWNVYEAVNRYRNSKNIVGNAELLLSKAIKLHAMHFFMSRVITFTKDSAKEVAKKLRKPMQLPYGRRMSSKLLGNQIKREMHLLQRALTEDVLGNLQKELRTKSRDSWATCFCVIVILSMCMEAVQIAADGFIIQTMIENDDTSPASRDAAIEIARLLDNRLFKDCMYIFHMIHRSGEPKSHKGFNPIRDGIEVDTDHGIDEHTVQLVDDMRRIMRDYKHELEEKARNLSWECGDDLLADHYRFRQQNSARLVARFLKSFLEES